ncbi:ASST-domain-containing protein [Neohortaea acidophila]|uniref:ASST-domain-containing protein n=1 Tax=Neohortaea acidophila TaxID=245834 RepID=A0A6A6Q6F6_9PEZI|nr:ASST-domain-containing protein [Neohortaea acidophila]KAF2487564.1 ASST-domain-containing protein [Neohortaea acidophila]
MRLSFLYSLLAIVVPAVLADWQFRSRSDLAVPRLNITIPATKDVEQGYLFVAPFAGFEDDAHHQYGPRQAGPYIFRDNGDLVWSGYGYYSIWATNFQKVRWNGRDVLASFEGDHNPLYGHGHGHITFLDQHYETIRELRAGHHKISDKHEFHVIDEKTALIQIYQPVPRDLSKFGAKPDQQWIVDAIFQELDIETGKVLFEWSSLDHISPAESVLPINPGQAGSGYNSSDAWDYYHINSVDKDKAGNYLLSARDACTVHKVNGTDGSIIWRLDGKRSSFKLGKGVKFCFQHHARFLHQEGDIEIISLYDNSAHGSEDEPGKGIHTAKTSSGKIIKLNTTSWTAELVQGFYPPDGLLSKSQGSTQVLPNRNVLVNWGSEGAMTEYLPNGTAIFHAYMDSGFLDLGVENYRAYRYNWTGLPNEDPAIAAFVDDETVSIYVSWNGDTETHTWRFFGYDDDGKRTHLGDVTRKSFETSLHVPEKDILFVSAEAIGASDSILRTTRLAPSRPEILKVEPGRRYTSFQNDAEQYPLV